MTRQHRLLLSPLSVLLPLLLAATPLNATNITQLTSTEFHDMALNNAFKAIIDVRTRAEWETGHVENATLLESLQLADTADEIATIADLSGCESCPIVVYCRSGTRAGQALQKLVLAGFKGPLYNGLGVNQWTEAGYELIYTLSLDPPCKNEDPLSPATCAKSASEGTPVIPNVEDKPVISEDVQVTVNMPDEPPVVVTDAPMETGPTDSSSSAMKLKLPSIVPTLSMIALIWVVL